MITLTADGAAIGALIFALIYRFAAPKQSPLLTLARFDARQSALSSTSSRPAHFAVTGASSSPQRAIPFADRQEQLGAWLGNLLLSHGITHSSLRQDLILTGRSYEAVMGRKIVAFTAGFLISVVATTSLPYIAGAALPAGVPAVVAALIAGACFILPDVEARTEATRRRADFRDALGAYLDLVALEMAGYAAPAEALTSAAKVGAGWPMALLRDTLYRASASGKDQWVALADLGERIAVPELRDLGALMKLVKNDGAQARESLTARAESMRRASLSRALSEAGERDQSMQMAQLLVGFGFIAFITYPAVMAVTAIS